jgi:hypothetical protein
VSRGRFYQTIFIIFFWYDLSLLAVFIIFILFCHQVVCLMCLVFRQTQESNSHPRTNAQTVSSLRLPLGQGASPTTNFFAKQKVAGARRLSINLPFNFTNDSVTEIPNQNLAEIYGTPFSKKTSKC